MSASSSSSSTSAVQPLVRKINDSLYELYAPPAGEQPTLEIIFFHGLHWCVPEKAFWETWTTSQNECWPQTWLAKELPLARILSVAYDASVSQSDKWGRLELYNIGENLVEDIICSKFADLGSCPVFLVAHSLGGLVVKQLILHAEKEVNRADSEPRLKTFLDNLGGIFYFSTPHHGADITNFRKFMDCFSLSYTSPVMSALSKLSASGARLNEDFRKWRAEHRVKAYAVNESQPTRVNGYSGIVVAEASARHDVDRFYQSEGNHFTICAPQSSGTGSGIQLLLDLIKGGGYRAHDVRAENFQYFPKYVVQIDRAVEEIEAKLFESSTLGLVGMGGVGKTTLAKAVFNILGPEYEYTCFIDKVKDIQGGVEAVKKAILKHVHHRGKKPRSVDSGLNFLQGKRLFVVLDDASDERDLEVLNMLKDGIVDEGSRFIVTSRDGEVVNDLDEYYEVPFLDKDSSTSLLTGLAFGNKQPPAAFQEYVDKVVTKCDGLPLTLEVIGKYLRKKGVNIWKQAIQALHAADDVGGFDQNLWRKLRVSYDGLEKEDKEMFLDAATIFHGRLLSEAKLFWNFLKGYDEMRWRHLLDLSLVKEEHHLTLIRMHEQLLSMGRKIALTSGENNKCTRVWNCTRAMELVTARNYDDMEDIVAFELPYGMPCLKVGEVDMNHFVQSILDSQLNVRGIYVMQNLDSMRDLMLVEYPRKVRDILWSNDHVQHQDDLDNVVTIMSSLGEEPHVDVLNSVRGLPSEEVMDTFLDSIIPSIDSELTRFVTATSIDFDEWKLQELSRRLSERAARVRDSNTTCISTDLLGRMKKLQYLYLANVDVNQVEGEPIVFPSRLVWLVWLNGKFIKLPFDPNLKRLASLKLANCNKLQSLPPNFGQLSALQHLQILHAKALVSLIDSFGQLQQLKHLELSSCPKLETLPETFGSLSNLTRLEIDDCGLKNLSHNFGGLRELCYLAITKCNDLDVLPITFGHLRKLQELEVVQCPKLLLMDCPAKLFDAIGNFRMLKKLEIDGGHLSHMLPKTLRRLEGGLEQLALQDPTLESILESEESLLMLKTLKLQWEHVAPRFPMLPGWLGNVITPKNIQREQGWIFNITDSKFNLEESQEEKQERLDETIKYILQEAHPRMMRKVEDEDYKGALAEYTIGVDLQQHLCHASHDRYCFYLQERGILKQLNGDFTGALKDLTEALEIDLERGEDNYECRKHRGLVRYLLGDCEEAQLDFEMAVKIQTPNKLLHRSVQLTCLGVESVACLGFNL